MAPPRIISGKYKGLRLQSVPGSITRPVTDRVKEALFNIIGADIVGANFLDLFGGTGSIGIEAISRGAELVFFIEKNYSAYKVLSKNLSLLNTSENFQLLYGDAFNFVSRGFPVKFDYIYVAPPQFRGMWKDMLLLIDANINILSPNAWVIAQIAPKEYEEIDLTMLKKFDQRNYGNTCLVFFIYYG